jgi:RHS repeat-associated protein
VVTLDTALTNVSVFDYDEYGLPPAGQAAQRYGWLGARQRSGDTLGGTVLMGVRLYSAALGRFLQMDPVPGGGATAYDYCFGDAVNCSDLDGRFSWGKVWSGVKSVTAAVYRHAGTIGTVIGTVSMFLPPPADLIGGAVGMAFSAVGWCTTPPTGTRPGRPRA